MPGFQRVLRRDRPTVRMLESLLTENGIDFGALLIFSLVVGCAGSIISLRLSKTMAKWKTGTHVIDVMPSAG
jgi:heat shock protein HtpX